jgi:hypothetical protein
MRGLGKSNTPGDVIKHGNVWVNLESTRYKLNVANAALKPICCESKTDVKQEVRQV